MSGTPTEAEIQTQWKNAVDILESTRAFLDDTLAGAGNKFDTLLQSLEGEYTPGELASAVSIYRSIGSSLIEPGRVLEFLVPIIFEYGQIISSSTEFGSGFSDTTKLFEALYQHFADNSLTVESRAISFDATPTITGLGNGSLSRLTVDENGYNMEATHVETKIAKCVADQNTGTNEEAETFEVLGQQSSLDALLRSSFGSGEQSRTFLRSHHAGSGAGGSLLRNSSFSTFDSTATPKFSGWTESEGGSQVSQDTGTFYRSFPGANTDASLKITGGGGTVTLKQSLANMTVSRLDPNTPYFLRIMVNPTPGTASGGTVTIRCGSNSKPVTIASMSAGWQEIALGMDQNLWPRSFGEDGFDVEIEWSGSSSGYLLVDDALFAPMELVDGQYWFIRGSDPSHTPWAIEDEISVTDTGGAPTTGKIQWWLFVSGLGYLPNSGSPTLADP